MIKLLVFKKNLSLRAGNTIPEFKWANKIQNFPVLSCPPLDPPAIHSMEQVTLVNQCVALLGFFSMG